MHSCTSLYCLPTAVYILCIIGYAIATPPCPCPEKWMPPFRASQLIYSEFPEDKGRSLHNDLERKDIHQYNIYNTQIPRDLLNSNNNHHGVASIGPGNGGGGTSYTDFRNPLALSTSQELSSEESMEYYKYHGYSDYKGEKNDLDDFSLESFELDPEVMKPPPPLEEDQQQPEGGGDDVEEQTVKDDTSDVSNSTEVDTVDSTDPAAPIVTTQLEVPSTQAPFTRPPLHVTLYPYRTIAASSYRNNAINSGGLQLIAAAKPLHLDKWRTVFSQRELSALQMLKPPPITQAWRKKFKLRTRPTIIYL